eukprot:SAG31_NODE_6357_length_2045_cov_1.766701_2_plen_132_part_00
MPRTAKLTGSVLLPDIASAYRETARQQEKKDSKKQQDRYGEEQHKQLVEYYRNIERGGSYNTPWPKDVLAHLGGAVESQFLKNAAQSEFKTLLFGSPSLDFVLTGDMQPLKVRSLSLCDPSPPLYSQYVAV